MNNGRLFILSGPSGCGKDTILKRVLAQIPEVLFSISSITRPMRSDEIPGEKYNFISVNEFKDLIQNDGLLEYNIYLGNYYGTPKKPIDDAISTGKEIIIEVDVNGASNIRKLYPDAISIFILPPSIDVLEKRLNDRGTEPQSIIKKRVIEARSEISRASEYDYIILNDNLDDAVLDLISIIKSDRLSLIRTKNLINEVLK